MNLGLEGKVFLITGGGSGIGSAITSGLLAEGAVPAILDRTPADKAPLFRDDGIDPKDVAYYEIDLRDHGRIEEIVGEVSREKGRVDGIINNAGVNDGAGLDRSVADFEASLQNNLIHAYVLVRAALPFLRTAKGTILNIGSKVFTTGQGGTSGYAAAKGGLASLTREWAFDLASDGIRCNSVIPAEVWTPMYEKWISGEENSEAILEKIRHRIPLGHRLTTPREIADTCLFLVSERASHTTGQILFVDGGYTHLDRS